VLRLAGRIGLTTQSDPTKVEIDLMKVVPEKQWTLFSNLLILHGRSVCTSRSPHHDKCKIVSLCDEGLRWKQTSAP